MILCFLKHFFYLCRGPLGFLWWPLGLSLGDFCIFLGDVCVFTDVFFVSLGDCWISLGDVWVSWLLDLIDDIICIIFVNFVFLDPLQHRFSPSMWDFYEDLESRNYLRSERFVLFLFHIHFYDVLEKLVFFDEIICTIIDDFVF